MTLAQPFEEHSRDSEVICGMGAAIHFNSGWVFVAARAFLQLGEAGAPLWLPCGGFSSAEHRPQGARLSAVAAHGPRSCVSRLWSTGSAVAAHGFSRYPACGIFPDRGLNLCLLRWQVASLLLNHQGSPEVTADRGHCCCCCMLRQQPTVQKHTIGGYENILQPHLPCALS